METIIQTLRNEIRKISLENVCSQTGISCVTVYRFTEEKVQMPLTQNPYVYIVLDGMLRLHTPSGIMDYMAGQYSISQIDSPLMGTILIPSEFMRKNIFQEIIYDILCGSCGKQFIQSIVRVGQADEIYEANSWIKENFRNSFTVESLAEQRNMSVSLFHQKFKSAVGMGPLQCQKRLRLTEARRLMLDDNKNVTEASVEVGYESVSQFIRDYRKMFGSAPKEDILNIQKHLKK